LTRTNVNDYRANLVGYSEASVSSWAASRFGLPWRMTQTIASTVRVTLAAMPTIQNQLMKKAGGLPASPRVHRFAPCYAAFFSSAGFFFSSVAGSGRSISVTSAIGALSPLRMPLFKMRR